MEYEQLSLLNEEFDSKESDESNDWKLNFKAHPKIKNALKRKVIKEEQIYQQTSLSEYVYPLKTIDKPIRLIELFAGIGAQYKALRQLTNKFERYKICEWTYNSICSYNAIHIKDFTDYSKNIAKEELIEKVRGISTDYKNALTDEQLGKKSIGWLRNAYNNIIATNNLINIMNVHGKDLEIVDVDKYEYIMTYSFPCQDLSLAGKRKGMSTSQKHGGTRSGLLWEVERILDELVGGGQALPQILIMENVPEVIGTKNIEDFQKWERKLESLGYKNYVEILNAKNYGIPQNRKRCFMISVLGEYAYNFPMKLKRKWVLKDVLERKVEDKYYLTNEQIEKIIYWKSYQNPLKDIEKNVYISPTITARGAGENHSGMILIDENLVFENGEVIDYISSDRFRPTYSSLESPTLYTHSKFAVVEMPNKNGGIPIMEATKKGYKVAYDGDGIDISGRMKYHRGTVQQGLAQTLKTKCDVGVVIEEKDCKRYKNYITWRNKKGEFNTECNRASLENDLALTIPTNDQTKVAMNVGNNKLRIRKLTPKECIRLMGFEDKDYETMRSIGMTDSAIYHMAGDSIVVPVLMSIFSQLMYEDNRHKKVVEEYIKKEILEEKEE